MILDSLLKAVPNCCNRTKPNNKYTKELTIHNKLRRLLFVKRQELKQRITISGQVRTHTCKLQLAIAVGMPNRMKLFVMFMGYVDMLNIKTNRASKKGKYTTEFSLINPKATAYPTMISRKKYSITNLYFFLPSVGLSCLLVCLAGLSFMFSCYQGFTFQGDGLGAKAKFCRRMNWELFSIKFSSVVLIGGGGSSMRNYCSNILRWSSCYFNFILYVKIGYLIEFL